MRHKPMSFYLPGDLIEAVTAAADADERSRSAWVERALRMMLIAQGLKPPAQQQNRALETIRAERERELA